jgi:hypothetical protein
LACLLRLGRLSPSNRTSQPNEACLRYRAGHLKKVFSDPYLGSCAPFPFVRSLGIEQTGLSHRSSRLAQNRDDRKRSRQSPAASSDLQKRHRSVSFEALKLGRRKDVSLWFRSNATGESDNDRAAHQRGARDDRRCADEEPSAWIANEDKDQSN